MVLGSAGVAFAATDAAAFAASSQATVDAGVNNQAAGDLTFTVSTFAPGDTVAIDLPTTALGGTDCSTTDKFIGFSALPTISAATSATTPTTKPSITGVLGTEATNNAACAALSVNNELTLTFHNSNGTSPSTYTVTISGIKYNVGAAVAPVAVTVTGPGGTASNATVVNTTVTTTTIGLPTGSSSASLNPIVVTDIPGGIVNTDLVFTLATGSENFTTAGTLTTPSGVTASGPSETLPSNTLTYTLSGTVPKGGVFKLTGSKISLANASQDHTVDVTSNAAAVGSTNAVVTATEQRSYAGINRYGTAAALFADAVGANTAVVASGVSFADALSANVAASDIGTGVLLTGQNSLPQETALALKSNANDIQTVYIIGGPAAVSDNVATAIAAIHEQNDPSQPLINVIRLSGPDRYATNNVVDLTFGGGSNAVIATGANFPDAISVAPEVVEEGYVLILTDPNTLSAGAQSTITNLGITDAVIVGGTAAVSANVETQLKGMLTVDYRIAGADRTLTASQIATWATSGLSATGSYVDIGPGTGVFDTSGDFDSAGEMATAFLTRGDTFPDALAAGAPVGYQGHVVLVTSSPSSLGAGVASYLSSQGVGVVHTIDTLGFAAAVNPGTVNAAVASLG